MFSWFKIFDCRCSFLGGLFAGIGSLAGAGIQAKTQEKINQQNIQMQKEFAQNGIQWKAQDAEKAGIHKLAGIGAQTYQATPSSVAPDIGSGVSGAMKHFGQAIDDYIDDKSEERSLQLERMKLENQKLKEDLNAKFSQGVGSLMSSNGGSPASIIVGDSPNSVSSPKLKTQTDIDKSIKVGNGLVLQKPLGNGDFIFTFDPDSTQGQKFSEGDSYVNQAFSLAHLYDQLRFGGIDKLEKLARERGYLKKGEYFEPFLDPSVGFILKKTNKKWSSPIDDVWNFGKKAFDLVVEWNDKHSKSLKTGMDRMKGK